MIAKRGLFEVPEASRQECLETNGMGGFASSSIIGMNTRRYHGLLTVALRPPVDPVQTRGKLVVGENRYELSCNQHPGAIHPQGYIYLHEFRLNPFPTFVYRIENLELEKTSCMVHRQNTIVTEYCVRHTGGEGPFHGSSAISVQDQGER